jgi:aspartate aminotransferase
MMAVLSPGDEVVIPNPHWMTFSEQAKILEAEPVLVESDEANGFVVTADMIERALTPRTKLVVLCSPSNPTGAATGDDDFRALGELAARRGFYLLWDDTYARLMFTPPPRKALATMRDLAGPNFLVGGSASKSYAMTGWRLGWALGPKEVISACAVLQSQMTSNASSISQRAALAALTGDQTPVDLMREEYRWRRDHLREALLGIPGVRATLPSGGFYLFVAVDQFFSTERPDSLAFARALLERERVAVVPGLAFGRDGYVRVSYATSRERIDEGVSRLKKLLAG